MAVPVLKIEIDELKNSIQHLERSNRELKDLLQTDTDPEYRLAIGENIITIAKKRARVAALEEELRRITGEEGEFDAVAVPVSEDANATRRQDAATISGSVDMQTEELEVARAEDPATSMEVDAVGCSGDAGNGSVGAISGAGDARLGSREADASSGAVNPAAPATGSAGPNLGPEGPAAVGAEGGSGASGPGVWL